MSNYTPSPFNGSITINNAPNSFGFNRRFSDLLERYAVNQQEIAIYQAFTAFDDEDPTAEWTLIAKGLCNGWNVNVSEETISLNISGRQLPRNIINRILSSEQIISSITDDIPSTSLGQAVPFVFGDYPDSAEPGVLPQVKPIYLGTDDTTAYWAVATTRGSAYQPSAVYFYVRDSRGIYVRVSDQDGNLLGTQFADGDYSHATISAELAADTFRAVQFQATDGWIVNKAYVYVKGRDSMVDTSTLYGFYTIEIWTDNEISGGPGVRIATGRFDKEDDTHATVQGPGEQIWVSFDKPVPLDADAYYWFVFGQTSTNSSTGRRTARYSGSGTTTYWVFQDNQWAEWRNTVDGNPPPMNYGIYGNAIDTGYTTANEQGLGVLYVSHTIDDTGSISDVDPANVDWVVEVRGDDDGVNYYEFAENVAALLTSEWDGSSWSSGVIDSTKFSSTHVSGSPGGLNGHRIRGATTGRQTAGQVLQQVMRESASMLTLVNSSTSGKYLGVWSWGLEETPVATLTDEDCLVLNIEERGPETIINQVDLFYNRKLTDADLITLSNNGVIQSYAGTELYAHETGTETDQILYPSQQIYGGVRYLRENTLQWSGSESAETLRDYLVRSYPFPQIYVTCEVPLYKYSTLEIMNVIWILHPQLSAFYGSAADARYPYYDGTDIDLVDGRYWKKAQRYRAQIESRAVSIAPDGYPVMTLKCRLLVNSPYDPT